jgi:hypothetical protein
MAQYPAVSAPPPQGYYYEPQPAPFAAHQHPGSYPPPHQQPLEWQHYPPAVAPCNYVNMGFPVMQEPQHSASPPPGTLAVDVQPPDCCDRRQGSLDIKVNGVVVGKASQGSRSEYQVYAGPQTVSLERGGVAGAIANFFGSSAGTTSAVVQIRPGQLSTLSVCWERDNCCSNRYHPRIYQR